jgi:hypothetical protein
MVRTANTVFVKNAIHNNTRTMVSALQHDLNLSHGTLIKTIQDSGFNKMRVCWVSHTLNNEWLVLVILPVVKNSFGTLSQKTRHGFLTIPLKHYMPAWNGNTPVLYNYGVSRS